MVNKLEDMFNSSENPGKKDEKEGSLFKNIVVGGALAALLGFGGYFFLNNNEKEINSVSPQTSIIQVSDINCTNSSNSSESKNKTSKRNVVHFQNKSRKNARSAKKFSSSHREESVKKNLTLKNKHCTLKSSGSNNLDNQIYNLLSKRVDCYDFSPNNWGLNEYCGDKAKSVLDKNKDEILDEIKKGNIYKVPFYGSNELGVYVISGKNNLGYNKKNSFSDTPKKVGELENILLDIKNGKKDLSKIDSKIGGVGLVKCPNKKENYKILISNSIEVSKYGKNKCEKLKMPEFMGKLKASLEKYVVVKTGIGLVLVPEVLSEKVKFYGHDKKVTARLNYGVTKKRKGFFGGESYDIFIIGGGYSFSFGSNGSDGVSGVGSSSGGSSGVDSSSGGSSGVDSSSGGSSGGPGAGPAGGGSGAF